MTIRLPFLVSLAILTAAVFLTCSPGLEVGDSDLVPPAPKLSQPSNRETVISATPTFLWQYAEDSSGYTLQIDDNEDFSSPEVDRTELNDLFYELSIGEQLTNERTYFWRVRSYNGYGNGEWSKVWQFSVDEAAYPTPNPSDPHDGAFLDNPTPFFDWRTVEAPLYSLAISDDPEFNSYILLLEQLEDSEYQMMTELTPGKTYYWAVRAGDGNLWGNWCETQELYLRFEDPDYDYSFDGSQEWLLDYGNYEYRNNPSRLHHEIYFQRDDWPNIAYEPFAHHLEPGDSLRIEFEFSDHNDPESCLGMYHGFISYLGLTPYAQSDMIAISTRDNNGQPEVNLTILNDYVMETFGAGEQWSQGYGHWHFKIQIGDWNSFRLWVEHNGERVHNQRYTLETTDFRNFLTIYAAVAAFKDESDDQWNSGRGYTGDFYRLSISEDWY